jgi:myosin heavy subunit
MRYFATVDLIDGGGPKASFTHSSELNPSNAGSPVSGAPKRGGGSSEIEEAVLATNPIMESFGN